jgi:hypothetical protein
MAEKEQAMIELTTEQVRAVETSANPPEMVNPRTGEAFILLRKDIYERIRQVIAETNERADWDDPAFDVYQ